MKLYFLLENCFFFFNLTHEFLKLRTCLFSKALKQTQTHKSDSNLNDLFLIVHLIYFTLAINFDEIIVNNNYSSDKLLSKCDRYFS